MKLSELLEDQTIPQLRQSIERGFPNTRKRQHVVHEVSMTDIKYLPSKKYKMLQIQSSTRSTNGKTYQQQFYFPGVDYLEIATDSTIQITGSDNLTYNINPLDINSELVKINCNCKDYVMRFAHLNANDGVHLGQLPPRYVRKTTDHPSANPNQVEGLCKHLLCIIEDELEDKGILRS